MSGIMEIQIRIMDGNGNESIEPIIIENEIPSIKNLIKDNDFRGSFDKLERTILESRKQASELAVKKYLESALKKIPVK